MEAQLEKELSFHLEQHMSQLVARGRAPDEARRQARLALGGAEQGEVPRRARHTLAVRFAAGHPLCASHIPAKARLHAGCAPDTGTGHRGYHRHVRGNQQCSAKAAVLPGTRQTGHFAHIHRTVW